MKVIVFRKTDGRFAVVKDETGYRLPEVEEISASPESAVFQLAPDVQAFSIETTVPLFHTSTHPLEFLELRESFLKAGAEIYRLAGKGAELLHWDHHTRFCGRCGAPTKREAEIMKRCPECGLEIFPHVSPCIIVLVRRGDEALLVHARNFRRSKMFGLVAGFVETGENLERCVEREIREETGLTVSNIRYFASQAWPFPSQLMIGFTADYVSGELCFADDELSAGGFFTRTSLPELPSPPSIARALIDAWLGLAESGERRGKS